MQVRCSACSTTFVVGDDIVRIVRKRGGTVPCRSCKAPIAITGDATAAAPPAKTEAVEPAKPKPVEPAKAGPVEPAKPKPLEPAKPRAVVTGMARPPVAPLAAKPAAPPPAKAAVPPAAKPAPPAAPPARPAAAKPHAPPPLPMRRASDKTRSLPPPVRSMAPPATIEADDWVEEEEPELEPELEPEKAPAPEPTHHARLMPPLPATSMLTLSESPPGAVVIHGNEAPAPIIVKPVAKAAPPPLPETPHLPETPSLTMTEATIDVVPRAPLMPSVALAQSTGSAPRSRSKVLVLSAIAAALLGGIIVVAIVHSRSAESDPTANHIAPAEDPRQAASVAAAPPPAPVEVPSAAASVEVPAAVASTPAPSPAASVEAPSPAASVEAPAPMPAEKKNPTETPPSEAIATAKPTTPAPAPAPRPAATPETDLSGLQPSKPARVDTRADDDTLQQALAQAAERAKGCRDSTSPTGVASVSVTIAGSGDATGAVVQGPPFAHTLEGDCIAAKFRAIHIPAFRGDSINVRKSVSLQ